MKIKFKELLYEETITDIKSAPQYCHDKKYIEWTAKTTPSRGKRVVSIMNDYFAKNACILDVGHSQGLTIGYTAQVFKNIQGVDTDETATATARKRLKKLGLRNKLHVYDGKKLPFNDNIFDGIITTEVFEHVNNRENYIKELHRVLKKSGQLIITSPNKLYPIECEFHLPFLSYLPKKLADTYVRLSKKGYSYDHINHPTYSQFAGTVNKYFTYNDITLHIIKNYKKYSLADERGIVIPIISEVIYYIKKLKNTPFEFIYSGIQLLLLNISAGWVLVCRKK